MSLEKRIKRHIVGRRHDFFAVTLPGYEGLCADELNALSESLQVSGHVNGGVMFSGRLVDAYLANLHVRTAGRILMRLDHFKATNFNQLETQTGRIAWELYLPPGLLPNLNVSSHRSRLYHTQAVSEHIEHSITNHWSDHGIRSIRSKDQTLFVRLHDDGVTLSLDSSGAPLHQRGLKTHAAHAPLRETMAAIILLIAGYQPLMPLKDPMCGAGTFSLEAALMTKAMPPGSFREFAFMKWPAFRSQQWAYLKKNAGRRKRRIEAPLIQASDLDEGACDRLRECIRHNDLEDTISITNQDFFSLKPHNRSNPAGLIVLNPPYGRRLFKAGDLKKMYGDIASKLRKDFSGWTAALLIPRTETTQLPGLSLRPYKMDHGGLKLTLLVGNV